MPEIRICSHCKTRNAQVYLKKGDYCCRCLVDYGLDAKRQLYKTLQSAGLGIKPGESKETYRIRMRDELLNRVKKT